MFRSVRRPRLVRMAAFEMAANATGRALRLGRGEMPPACRRDKPVVVAMGLRRAVRRPVLEMWQAQRAARNRLPGPMQAPWRPRWPARGVSRVRAPTRDLML